MTKITRKIKQFITKSYNIEKDNYCWYNTQVKLSPEDLYDLVNYFNKSNYNFMLIINGCSQLRPQRTWGSLPTFLKGIDGCHLIFKSLSNSFILCSWLEDYKDYKKDMEELLLLPEDLEVYKFKKWGVKVKLFKNVIEDTYDYNAMIKKYNSKNQLVDIQQIEIARVITIPLEEYADLLVYKGKYLGLKNLLEIPEEELKKGVK